ncbi:MAG TPA: FtsX-like permease family protein [Cyclobacteriaceae bacterium]|nr:FtsX-like permease family protein [Cyclobacteriaceae bacterium]
MQTRYSKVLRDLTSDYSKNFMLVLAIAIGVFGIGSILGGYSVIKREMTDNYMSTVPASATIELEDSITTGLVDSIKNFPGIKEAERHATLVARMKVGEKWYPLLLFVVDDFENKKTNKPIFVSGERKPTTGTMLVERTAFKVMQAKEGDQLMIKTPHGQPKKIKLSGTVHDPGLAPAWQEQAGYGYITLSTLQALGETQGFDQLRILVKDQPLSREHITKKAQELAAQLTQSGYHIHEIQVPPPGKHPHQGQMSAVMSIFIVFSFLILILGSILVATSMATLMVKQVRQIGVMKTIGAQSAQITGMYIVMVILLCIVALLFAIPLSRLAALGFYNQIAVLLNLEIRNNSIPYWVPLLQVASGIVIPLIAAAFPVIRGSLISVRSALDNHGVNQKNMSANSWAVKLSQLDFFSETFRLSLRNVFRQRQRLVMTLGLLAAGGAMFMTAMNVSEAWNKNLSRIYKQRLYDLEVRVNKPIATDSILDKIKSIEGVKAVEGWSYSPTSFVKSNAFQVTQTYPDKGHGSFTMLAMPVPTQLLNLTIVDGHWLNNKMLNEVVLNQSARGSFKIGDHISLSIDGQPTEWTVVGFTEDVGSPATAYVSLDAFFKVTNATGQVKMLRVAYADRSRENAISKNRSVESLLEKENISVLSTIPVWLLQNAIAAHMKVLVNSLMAMAILMALVGTLGLMSTMSMNILERTREIAVMRAIGATPKKIRNLIVWEGLFTGSLSIFIAIIFALALSTYLGRLIGNMAFRTPLSLTVSVVALVVWTLLVAAGSYVATIFPARRANKITTREALAYE